MKRRILLIALVITLIIPVGLIGLMSTESGSRWLLQNLFASLPARVSVAGIEGRLLERISLTSFNYESDTDSVTISHFAFAWQPSMLFSGTLKIVDLSIDGVHLSVGEAKEEQPKSSFDIEAGLRLPLQLVIENILLTNISVSKGNQIHELKKLQFSAATDENQLTIKSLAVNTPEAEAALQGRIALGNRFPLSLKTAWKFDAKNNGLWQGATTVSGDLHKLVFDNQLSTPFKLVLQGNVEDVLNAPRLTTRGDWQKAMWPLTAGAAPQIQSEQGYFELTGLLSDYQLTVNAKLNQQYLQEASLTFDGKGSLEAMSIKNLELKSATGLFQLAGDVAWKDAPAFDLSATGQHFNPAIILPEMPGDLTFNTHLKGKMATGALQLDADINKLSGRLRSNPVSAQGKLLLHGDLLQVEALQIVSGANKLALDGALGQQQTPLKITLNMPELDSLWPNLGGKLKGDGYVQGAWKNPTVKFDAKATHLSFAEHSIGQLDINIDYHPEITKTSAIQLSASAINSGATHITQLLIDGQGTTAQHRFTADIRTAVSDLSAAFTGRLKANIWQGDFSRLDANHQDFGLWRLKKNLLVRITQKAPAVDVAIDESCLVQQAASICVNGQYNAGGDLRFALTTTAVPIELLQAYLPKQTALQGVINGEANIQRQKGVFSGRYRFELPPSMLFLTDKKIRREIALGASSVSGNIKGDVVSADIDLVLAAQDYVRGQLQMNLGKSQSLSGQVSASLNEFAMIEPFIPQVSGIKGHLQADLSVKGQVQKPMINGRIDLADGAVDTAQMGLRDINLHALVTGNSNRIQLQGSAKPAPIKTGFSEPMKIRGLLTVDADIQQQKKGLAGHYRLAIPANTSIVLKSGDIVLGASSLSGNLNGSLINADIDVDLPGQDYCRGKLLVDTGKTQALSGQLSASVSRFGLIEVFVPQVSKLKGLLTADVNLDGTLQKPLVNGAINFSKGAVDVVDLGLGIRDINVNALAAADHPEHIKIQGSAKSGEGFIKVDGVIGLQAKPRWPVELTLDGENFEIAKIPEAQIAISPDIKLQFADGQGKVSGKLTVPKAIMVMKDLPENAVKTSKDEIILGEEKTKEEVVAAPGIDADIAVELGKQVSFSGQGLQTNLEGHLRITTTAGKMAMNGNVDMIKAGYKHFGQDLTVRTGRFLFSGPVDNPWLDVEAIRLSKSKKVTAVLSLSGPLKSPKTRISSEPSLPEADALAYLITGGPLNQVSKSDSNVVASAALSYGAGQLSWVSSKLGIDEFGVEEGETLQDTLVTVGQYLTPDFYVGTKVGVFNKQAFLVLKHKIFDKINVETQTGTSKRIKLNYEFDTD